MIAPGGGARSEASSQRVDEQILAETLALMSYADGQTTQQGRRRPVSHHLPLRR
jgi:hypothetical protein